MDGVAIASGHARRLVEREARRSGRPFVSRSEGESAIDIVARRLRSTPGAIWSLLYRTPKRVHDDLAAALERAVKHEIEAEIGVLNVELVAIRAGVRRCDPIALAEVEEELARLRAILARGRK